MNRRQSRTLIAFVAMLFIARSASGQDGKSSLYPKMAPLDQYLIGDRSAEIVLAQSAAPKSISGDAKVLVLGRKGYETAIEGKNGFVCMVLRSWASSLDDPEFWNPKLRAPICFNAAAAESDLPHITKKTEWALAGLSKAEIVYKMKAAIENKQLGTPEPGAMCYMLSKQGYLNDRDGHWHPHLMFFVPPTDPTSWGAGMTGSPMFGFTDSLEQVTVFLLPVERWSDGSVAGN
jgi:hypothetical protein